MSSVRQSGSSLNRIPQAIVHQVNPVVRGYFQPADFPFLLLDFFQVLNQFAQIPGLFNFLDAIPEICRQPERLFLKICIGVIILYLSISIDRDSLVNCQKLSGAFQRNNFCKNFIYLLWRLKLKNVDLIQLLRCVYKNSMLGRGGKVLFQKLIPEVRLVVVHMPGQMFVTQQIGQIHKRSCVLSLPGEM